MAKDRSDNKSLVDRIKEGLRDIADDFLDTARGLLNPAPEPVLIPVRVPVRRYR